MHNPTNDRLALQEADRILPTSPSYKLPLRGGSADTRIRVNVPHGGTGAARSATTVEITLTTRVHVLDHQGLSVVNGPTTTCLQNLPLGSGPTAATVRRHAPLSPTGARPAAASIKKRRGRVLVDDVHNVAMVYIA